MNHDSQFAIFGDRPSPISSFLFRFLNDQEIADGGNFILGEKDSVYRLDIGSVDSDLVGKLKVTAENENGKDQKEVRKMFSSGSGAL